MFWPIFVYLLMSIAIAATAVSNAGWSAGLSAVATISLFLVAGGGLKASLWWGDKSQKIAGPIVAVLLVALAHWLSGGFAVHLFGYFRSGGLWGWIGFAICFVFANKKLARRMGIRQRRHQMSGMNLDLTDTEAKALTQELIGIIESSRYPLSPRIQTLRAILDKLVEPVREPLPPRKVYEPPSKGRWRRRG
jgi:hypothetical protein